MGPEREVVDVAGGQCASVTKPQSVSPPKFPPPAPPLKPFLLITGLGSSLPRLGESTHRADRGRSVAGTPLGECTSRMLMKPRPPLPPGVGCASLLS